MSLGTLSESRIAVAPTATPNSTVAPDISKPDKNTQQVLENTTVTTTATTPTNTSTTTTNDGLVTKPTPEPSTAPTPAVVVEVPKKTCAYCMAKSVTSLAFQISVILLVLALSFHLVKKV